MADITVADISTVALVLVTIALVGVTLGYARSTKKIADASTRAAEAAVETARLSERSAQTGMKAAEAAARSAKAAEDALVAQSMPFVRPSFGSQLSNDARCMVVTNSGRHAALNVELFLGSVDYLLHTFPVVAPGESKSHEWKNDQTAKRLAEALEASWVLRARYSDPYGNCYEVQEEHVAPDGVTMGHRVSTYRIAPDGKRTPLGRAGS